MHALPCLSSMSIPCPESPTRTRIKICGLREPEHVEAAVAAGADAIGLVFYPPSVRAISIAEAQRLVEHVPAFVSVVGLFVAPKPEEVEAVLRSVRIDVLQFHGAPENEPAAFCASFGRAWIKAAAVDTTFDLLQFRKRYEQAAAILLDAPSAGHGGSGRSFDWQRLAQSARIGPQAPYVGPGPRLVLSGGLTAANVAEAIALLQPYAVDVSSGVEARRGEKSSFLIAEFCQAVRQADLARSRADRCSDMSRGP